MSLKDFEEAASALGKRKKREPDNVIDLWERELTQHQGKVAKTLRNVTLVLTNAREFRGAIVFDDFAQRIVSMRKTPAGEAGPWTDDHDLRATFWLQGSKWRLEAGDDLVSRSVRAVAAHQRVHPLKDRLAALRWDGVPRVDTWTTTYLGAEDTAVHRAIGTTWLLGAVARAFKPGCKVDNVLILEGKQGRGKSTALKILSLGFFSDELADIGSKDAAMQLQGAWIHEIAELDAISRAEASRVKAFLTRSADRFRPPWGRHVVEVPRQCVFAGTVNHDDYLRDETGGRRFWPVRIEQLDLAALQHDAEQLWAEAVTRFRNGEPTYIREDALRALIEEHTGKRYQADAWEKSIAEFAQVRESVSVGECLTHVGLERGRWTQADQTRVARCLKALGYERRQQMTAGLREWRYFRPLHQRITTTSGQVVMPLQSEKTDPVSSSSSYSTLSVDTQKGGGTEGDQGGGGELVKAGAVVQSVAEPPAPAWWEVDP